MSAIEIVLGRQILDSRGNPTVEVDVHLVSGAWDEPFRRRAPRPGFTRPWNCVTGATPGRQGRPERR